MRKLLFAATTLMCGSANAAQIVDIEYHDNQHNLVGWQIIGCTGAVHGTAPANYDHKHRYAENCGSTKTQEAKSRESYYQESFFHDVQHNEIGFRIIRCDGSVTSDRPAEWDHIHSYTSPCSSSGSVENFSGVEPSGFNGEEYISTQYHDSQHNLISFVFIDECSGDTTGQVPTNFDHTHTFSSPCIR